MRRAIRGRPEILGISFSNSRIPGNEEGAGNGFSICRPTNGAHTFSFKFTANELNMEGV